MRTRGVLRPPRGRSELIPSDPTVRRLAVMTLVNSSGNGLYYAVSALFFTRIVGLSVTQVGVGLTVAGALGVAAGIPLGHLADRVGVRPLLVILLLATGAGMASYPLVHSFAAFVVILSVTTIADRGASAVRNAMYAVVLPARTRTSVLAYLRTIVNVGVGSGSALAAVALSIDTQVVYVALILFDAGTFVVSALIMFSVEVAPGHNRQVREPNHRGHNRALNDRPFLAITGLSAVLSMQQGLLEIGVPLWIVGHTDAPRVIVAVAFVLNTVLVVALQVRASRHVDTVPAAARGTRWAGWLLAAACMIYALSAGLPAWAATALILGAMAVQTLGEVVSSAAGWQLSYDLADPGTPGAYQGVFTSGSALGRMLAPTVVTLTALHLALPGWAILACVFAASGTAMGPAAAAASRRSLRAGDGSPARG